MRILIDECLDWRFARGLPQHEVTSVQRAGWAGIKNGELLRLAEQQFDVFITGDRNLSFQQNVSGLNLIVVVLQAPSTQLKDTLPLLAKVSALLPTLKRGAVVAISA